MIIERGQMQGPQMKMYVNMCICKFPHAVQDRVYVNKDEMRGSLGCRFDQMML